MRALLIPICAIALMGASGEAEVQPPVPDERSLSEQYQDLLDALKEREGPSELTTDQVPLQLPGSPCTDRLERAYETVETPVLLTPGPLLRRGPNTPETPLAIYAVDRRENGCGVMVMMGDINDVRPVPMTNPSDYRVMPAEDNDR